MFLLLLLARCMKHCRRRVILENYTHSCVNCKPKTEHDPGNDSAEQLFAEDVCSCCSA